MSEMPGSLSLTIEINGRKDEHGNYEVYVHTSDMSGSKVGALNLGMEVDAWNRTSNSQPGEQGIALQKLLFADETVNEVFKTAIGRAQETSDDRLHVLLRIRNNASELHALNWEYLPLARDEHTPFTRIFDTLKPAHPPLVARPLNMAVAIASPSDLAAKGLADIPVGKAIQTIVDAVEQLVTDGQLEVTLLLGQKGLDGLKGLEGLDDDRRAKLEKPDSGWTIIQRCTTSEQVLSLMDQCHIFHFLGHGGFTDRVARLYLETATGVTDDQVTDSFLCGRLELAGRKPYLIFLSACESAKRDAETDQAFMGLGPRLIESGVPAVVAMQKVVELFPMLALSQLFYERLFEDGMVDLALNHARRLLYDEKSAVWAPPVLFGRLLEDGRLFADQTQKFPLRNIFDQLVGIDGVSSDYVELFAGRDDILKELEDFLVTPDQPFFLITGGAGLGKTALMANLVHRHSGSLAYHFFTAQEPSSLQDRDFLKNLLQQMGPWYGDSDATAGDFQDWWSRYLDFLKRPLKTTHIIVLDGLDEVTWDLKQYFSRPLSVGLHFIVTAREEDAPGVDLAEVYGLPVGKVRTKRLTGLTREGVQAVFALGKAAHLVEKLENLDKVMSSTAYDQRRPELGADPMYVHFLAQESNLTIEAIKNLPVGMEKYLQVWWDQLLDLIPDEDEKAPSSAQAVSDLTGTLASALGPIGIVDLKALHPVSLRSSSRKYKNYVDEDVLKNNSKLRRIIGKDIDGNYILKHPRLRDYIRKQFWFTNSSYDKDLPDYCSKWADNKSTYALTYYANHLFSTERWSELFALACDENYFVEQDKAFPEDIDLPLRTISWAIEAAMKLDDPVKMGELILRRAARADWARTQETPLDALRAGLLDRSVSLAELFDFERRALWLLLLSWELQDTGKKDAAREVLRHLQSMKFQHLSDWSGACTAFLLLPVAELSSEVFTDLGERLLWRQDAVEVETWHSIRQVSEILVHRGYYQSAVEPYLESWPNDVDRVFSKIARQKAILGDGEGARNTVDKIRKPAVVAQAMAWIATEKAKAGKIDEAREALKSALDLAHNSGKEYAIAEVAVQQAQAGLLEEALHTCEQVTLSLLFINTLTRIAICWHERQGNSEPLLLRASQYVYEKLEPEYRTTGLSTVAIAYAQTSRTPIARQMLDALINRAIKDQDAESLSDLTRAQADAGFFDAALQTLSRIEESGWKSNARKHIIERLAVAGQFDEALEMARSVSRGLSSFVSIAGELAKSGQSVKARGVFAEILAVDSRHKDPWTDKDPRSGALYHIVVAEAQNGRFEDARSIAQHINSDSYYYTAALEQIAVEQVRLDELTAAEVTLEELRQISRYACNRAGTQIVMSLADKDNLVKAREFTKFTERTDRSAEAAIIVAEARTGNVVGALAGARALDELAPRAIGRIAEIAFRSGHADDFQKVDLTFRSQKSVVQTNVWIAYAYMRDRQVLTAEQILQQALLDSRQIEETKDRQEAMVDIAVVQRCAGRIQDAEETLTRAVHVLRRSSESVTPYTEGNLRKRMVDALVEAGERVAAFEQAVRIEDLYEQAEALLTITGKPAPQGFPEAVLHNMRSQIKRHSWIPYMAEALVKAGDKESFKQLLVPSADNIDSAYRMCGLLAKLYPDHTKELLRIVYSG